MIPIQNSYLHPHTEISPLQETTSSVDYLLIKIVESVAWVANKIFVTISFIYSVPARYFGSKSLVFFNTSSYETSLTPLTKEEAKEYVVPASLCATVHHTNEARAKDFITPFDHWIMPPQFLGVTGELPGNLEVKPFCFYDPVSHLKVMVAFNERNELWVAFGAAGSGDSEETTPNLTTEEIKAIESRNFRDQHLQIVGNLLGARVAVYEQASAFMEKLLLSPAFQGKKVTLVGQSLGASIAQYVGIKHQLQTICFNGLQLGAGLQYLLGRKKIAEAHHFIRHVSAKTDHLSDSRYSFVDRLISLLGIIRTPGNFGKRFSIPTAYDSTFDFISGDTHTFILGSVMDYVSDGSQEYDPATGGPKVKWIESKKKGEGHWGIEAVNKRSIPKDLPPHLRTEFKRLSNSPIDVHLHTVIKENNAQNVDLLRFAMAEFGLLATTPSTGAPSDAVKWQLFHLASAYIKKDKTIHYGDWFGFAHLSANDLATLFIIVSSYHQYRKAYMGFDNKCDQNTLIFKTLSSNMKEYFLGLAYKEPEKARAISQHLTGFFKRNPDLDKTALLMQQFLHLLQNHGQV